MSGTRTRYTRELILCVCVIAGIVVFDQCVKYWARTVLQNATTQTAPFIPGFMLFRYMENTGAAFSICSGRSETLGILSAALAAFIIWLLYLYRDDRSLLFRLGLCFIAGGAIGNVIDRMSLGYVVDMLEFEFTRFAVFNVADCFVCIGAVMFCIYIIFFARSAGKQKSDQGSQDQSNAG